MGLFLKVIAVLKMAVPVPNFRDLAAVTAWLQGLVAAEADLIVSLVNQFLAIGQVEIDLPDGQVVTMMPDSTGCWVMAPADDASLAAALASHMGEPPEAGGKWLEVLKWLMPILLQFLPILLKKAEPPPIPGPQPA